MQVGWFVQFCWGTVSTVDQINCKTLMENSRFGVTYILVWLAGLQNYSEWIIFQLGLNLEIVPETSQWLALRPISSYAAGFCLVERVMKHCTKLCTKQNRWDLPNTFIFSISKVSNSKYCISQFLLFFFNLAQRFNPKSAFGQDLCNFIWMVNYY